MNLLTRRFPTILGLLLLIVAVVGGWWFITTQKPTVAGNTVPRKVRITNVTDSKFSVSWTTPGAQAGSVEYGPVGAKLTEVAKDDRDTGGAGGTYLSHHVTITGLQPGTQYAFRILSGSAPARYDNNGSPYSITTGPTIAETPPAKSLYGEVSGTGASAAGTLVYLTLPGAEPVSTLVTSSNNYSFSLSTIRTDDLTAYIQYDTQATVANITLENGTTETTVVVTTANAQPVPKILLGQNADYRSQVPPIAQVEPLPAASAEASTTASTAPSATTPGIFNVEPLAGSSQNAPSEVTLINPSTDGETVATTKPEIRGTGPSSTTLSITIHSTSATTGSVTVNADGTWSWTPTTALSPGQHTLTIAYKDAAGVAKTITRTFTVSPALAAEGDPAFVASPSASVKTSPSPSVKASTTPIASTTTETSPAASPREIIPSTESGVPVTGIITPTLMTGLLGLAIMVVGAFMLAL